MRSHFPFVKRTVEKIADGGPNIPLWNLVDFGDKNAIHRTRTSHLSHFKNAIKALKTRNALYVLIL